MKFYIKNALLIATLFLIYSCSNTSNPIVIKVDDIKINKEDFLIDLNNAKTKYETEYQLKFSEKQYNLWLDEYINNLLIYNEALKLGYDKDPEVLYTCLSYEKYLLSQENDDFYKEITEKKSEIVVSDLQLWRTQNQYKYTFEILTFESLNQIKSINNKTSISLNDFNNIKIDCKEKNIKFDTITDMYPFNSMLGLKKYTSKIKENTCLGPILIYNNPYKQEYIILKCIKKEELKQNLNEIDDGEIYAMLHNNENPYLFHRKLYEFYDKSKYLINNELISKCYKNLEYIESTNNIDPNSIKEYFKEKALTYTLNNKIIVVTIADFYKFYTHLPIIKKFKSQQDFKEYFLDIIAFDYLRNESIINGYINKPEVINACKRLKKNVIIRQFLERNIYKNLSVPDSTIYNFYTKNIQLFSKPKDIIYDILIFKTFESASKINDSINKYYNSQKTIIDNFNQTDNNIIEIERNNTITYSTLFEKNILNQKYSDFRFSNISKIFKEGNFYKLAIKRKNSGLIVIPFIDVKYRIKLTLLDEKEIDSKTLFIKKIKLKSKIQIDFNFADYIKH